MGNEASQEGGMPPGQAGQPGGQYPPGAFPPPQQMRPPQQGPTMGAQQRPMQGGPMGMGQQRPMMVGPMGPSVGQQRPAMIGMGPGQQRPMLGGPAGATQQQRPMLGGMAGPGTPQQRSMMGGPTMSQQRGITPSAVPPGGQPPPDVDLSNLSEEEKEMILSVMARAQDMDQDLSQQKRPIEQQRQDTTGRQVAPAQQDQRRQICPVCRAAEITNETSAKCNDCGKTSCQRCGTFMPGLDGKRPTWICIECTRRRQPYAQQTARIQEQQMRQQERTRMSGDIEAARLQQQQQQHQLQQQPQHPFQQQASGMQAAIRAGSLQQQQSYQGQPMMDRITTQQQAITGSGLYAGPDSMMTSQAKMADGGRREDAKSREYPATPAVDTVVTHDSQITKGGGEPRDIQSVTKAYDYNGNGIKAEEMWRRVEDTDDYDEEYHKVGEDEDEEEDSDEEEEDEELEVTPSVLQTIPYYDRSPGDVYTILEEDEPSSPGSAVHRTLHGTDLNSDTASSLIRWRGVGQAYQRTPSSGQQIIQVSVTDDKKRALSQVQQSGVTGEVGYQRGVNGTDNNRLQQKAVTTSVTATTFQQQANVAQTIISTSPQLGMQSRYTNFVQTSASATTTAQSTEAKKATSAVTAIPRTVPLMSVNQTSQQQPQQPVPTTQQQANSGLSSPKQKPKSIDLQAQKKQKSKPDPQDWSPVTDLSPIMDVSPSIEAAEQELMEQFREKTEEDMVRTVVQANIPRATSGTISGMLADFNKALGLAGTSPVDEGQARYGTGSEPPIQPQVQTSAMVMMSTEMPMDQNQNILQQQHYQQQIQQQQQQQQPWQQQQLHQFQQTSQAYQQQPPQWQQQSQQQQQMMQQQQQQQQQQQLMQQQQLQQLQQQVQQQQQQEQIQLQQQQQQLQSQVPQTQTQRRIHRRLPQPTMEQMQAAVAMAAQSPRGKSVSQTRASTSQPISMGMTSVSTGVTQRSVSPSIPQRTTDLSSTTLGQTTQQVSSLQTDATWMQQVSVGDQTGRQYVLTGSGTAAATILTPALPMSTVVTATVASSSLTPQPNGQYLQAVQMQPAVSPIHGEEQGSRTRSTGIGGTSPVPGYGKSMTPVTPQTPSTPRDKGDSSDTLSEADSLKMGKVRRKLPPLPQDQEPSSIPTRRAKDRMRTLSSGATPLTQQERSKSPFHTSSLDGGITMTPSNISDVIISTSPRQSASESYLQMISSGRTLGLSEGSSLMGRRDLSAPHNLSSYLRDSSSMTGTKLPSYIKSLRQQLREELKSVTEDRRRILDRDPYYRRSETDLSSLLSHSWPEDRYDTLSHRKLLHSSSPTGLLLPTSTRWQSSPRTSPQPSPRRIRHRRHASDPKVPLFSPIKEDRDSELDLGMQGYLKHPVGQPFKSFEFESIDDRLGGDGLLRSSRYGGSLGSGLASKFYQRGSSLSDIRFGEDTDYSQLPLRDTGFFDSDPDEYYRRYAREMMRYRRPSDGSLYTPPSLRAGLDPWDRSSSSYFLSADRKKRKDRKPRKPRSWHPSPYVSEDEDDQTSREKRKAKIKAEIARRRHQIQENARLHEELYKLARMRDGSEKRAPYGASSVVGADHAGYSAPVDAIPRSIAEGYGSTGSSSVLQAIDEILRRDVYGSYPRRLGYESYGSKQSSMYTTAPSSYTTLPRSRYDYLSSMKNWYGDASSPSTQFPDTTAEDKSIARIASTFQHESRTPPELHLSVPFDPMSDFSPMTTDTETPTEIDPTPAMPLLPDMPTRSRKILEDLGSSPIVSQHGRSGHQASYREYMEVDRPGHSGLVSNDRMVDPVSVASRQTRKPQASSVPKATQKYHFPIKRILLTRDPKDRSVSGNGLGMKVIGGKDIPGSNGLIGAYVARIYPGGVVETLGEVKEGDQVLEWNGIPLTGKTYEDVQRIIASSGDEVEIVIRSDFNMLDPYASFQQRGRSPRLEQDRGGAGAGQGAVRSSQDSSRSGSKNPHYGSPSRGRESPHGTSRRGNPSPYDSDRPNHEYSSSNRNPNSTSHVGGLTSDHRYGANQHPPPNNPSWTTSHPPNSKNDNMNDSNKAKYRAENITGEIQLQICYDAKAAILYVTIVRARELVTTRDNSGLPDPFVKCYLLPGRCMENQRRTRYFSRCSNPEWKQTMVYPNVPLDTLKKRQLEISVWNYDIYRPNEFLGEVTLDLSVDSIIDEQARWYKLQDHHRIGSGPNPSCSLGQISDVSNGSGKKMARLNNPGNKEDLRKAVSNQAHRLSLFSPNNMSTHPLVAQGCHAAVCNIL